jgi:hypothetical protein
MDDSSSRLRFTIRRLPAKGARTGDSDDCRGVVRHGRMRWRFLGWIYYAGHTIWDLHGHCHCQIGKFEPHYRAYGGRPINERIG